MKARIELDVWFDDDNITEDEFKRIMEDAIDTYNGSADVKSVNIILDEEEDAPVLFIIGYLDYDGIEHAIVETGYEEKGKYYDIITKSGGVHRVYHISYLITNIKLH